MEQERMVPIVGRTWTGRQVWYTGKAGDGWVSVDHRAAFLGFNLEGARRKALALNRMAEVHGVLFTAVNGDLLELFSEVSNA